MGNALKKPLLLFVDTTNCQTSYFEGDYFNSSGATFTVVFDVGLSQAEAFSIQKSWFVQFAYDLTMSRPLSYLNWSVEFIYSKYIEKEKAKRALAYAMV